jgi:ribosomal protein S18 acetylase RimI-like enzyme
MNPETGKSPRIAHATAADEAAALELLLSPFSPPERREKLARLRAETPPAALWVAYRGIELVGAIRSSAPAGRAATVSRPKARPGEPEATARALVEHAVRALEAQGVQLVQAVVESDRRSDIDRFVACGFRHVADLLYLVSSAAAFPDAPPANELAFVAYDTAGPARLARVVERTYEGSLDCPALEGARDVNDVLAGYRASGPFDPGRWLLVRQGGEDVGCLLLADDLPGEQWELVYMGVVPEARGRGLGLAMARHAQWMARCAQRKRLVLAVDEANLPAKRAYAAAGFVSWDARSVLVLSR